MRLGGFDLAALRLPGFATGGIVPGRAGEPKVIIAHGGERVEPAQPIRLRSTAGGAQSLNVNVSIPVGKMGSDVTLDEVEAAAHRIASVVTGDFGHLMLTNIAKGQN